MLPAALRGSTCGVSQGLPGHRAGASWAVPRLLSHGAIKRRCRSFPCSILEAKSRVAWSFPWGAVTMSGLNVSIAFFLLVVSTCEMLRRLSKRLLSPGAYCCLAGELTGSLQLCSSCLELRMLLEIGPWGGGFGPDVVFTLLFLLFMVHAASLDGASANPTVSLQEFLLLESGPAATAAKLLAQAVGVGTGWAITKLYWSWELTQFHLIQNLIASECSSSIRTSLYHGAFVEGACSFLLPPRASQVAAEPHGVPGTCPGSHCHLPDLCSCDDHRGFLQPCPGRGHHLRLHREQPAGLRPGVLAGAPHRDARCPLAVPRQHPKTLPKKPALQPEEQIQDTQGTAGACGGWRRAVEGERREEQPCASCLSPCSPAAGRGTPGTEDFAHPSLQCCPRGGN
uniref:Aquaporin-12 n=1 Tax=Anas platyrhynchos TaxID=8839 RepID=A0A8B9TTS7_ANAPL